MKEKTADEMFEALEYEVDSTYEIDGHLYFNKKDIRIDFDFTRRNFYKYSCLNNCRCPISVEELQAIYEFCKEKGWLDVEVKMKKIIEVISCKKFEDFVNICVYDLQKYENNIKDIENFIEFNQYTYKKNMENAQKYLQNNFKNIKLEYNYVNLIGNTIDIYSVEVF